jgi:hypothetical protein
VNGWKFCIVDPQDAALDICGGTMDEGDGKSCGFGNGFGNGDGWGGGVINGYGDGSGWGDGYGFDGGRGNGFSPEEWK